jgi:hypothetical protein
MNKFSTPLTYAAVAATLSLCSFRVAPAGAVGFSGSYAPSNFSFTGNGSVNTTGAPNSIQIVGLDATGTNDYTTTALSSGLFSFNWNYRTFDDRPVYDPFFVLKNGVATRLSDSNGANTQSSTYSTSVNIGDTIGWRIQTDSCCGASQVTISNFSAPEATAVPEPFTIIGTCIGGTAAYRIRKKLMASK